MLGLVFPPSTSVHALRDLTDVQMSENELILMDLHVSPQGLGPGSLPQRVTLQWP